MGQDSDSRTKLPTPSPAGCLKVALVDLDGQPVPDWVRDSFDAKEVELTIHQCKSREDLATHAADADVVWLFGGSRILAGGNLDVLARCWAIVRTGSGTDNVPVDEASRRGILVANTPAAFSDSVSDHAIALLLAVARQVVLVDRTVRRGNWDPTRSQPLSVVAGRTLGLVGFGHSARQVARKLRGFELNVLAYDPQVDDATMAAQGVRKASLDALLAASDFVSLHCPLTAETTHLIGRERLRSMKPTAILVNTSRGPVVDEAALVQALSDGWIAGAGLDVIEKEPPAADNPLLKLDNVVLTPHMAGASADGLEARWRLSIETIRALARRQWPASCVNRDRNVGRNLKS
jgi:D-3-phosphoglycerate dehydrogenase / 2-oxoglutarate reductase